ncbi:MAG: sensor histidine kinase [Candidatus Humimicrobiaceae bacterium]
MKTIKEKLLVIFILIFAVLAANSIIAIINFSTLKNSIDNILKSNYESVLYAQNMVIAIERQDSAELAMIFEANKENPIKLFKDYETNFQNWLDKAKNNITEKGEDLVISNINSLYKEYLNKFSKFEILLKNKNSNEKVTREYYYNEIFPLFENIKDECRNLLNINQDKMVVLKNESAVIAKRATFINAAISIATIALSLIFIIYLLNKIIRSLTNLNSKIKEIAKGDYSQKLNVSGSDEIASLSKEFNIMASKLQAYDLLNINQLMKEKQKIEAIVESISDGVVVTGASNRILLINKAAEKIFNISEEEFLKKDFTYAIKNPDLFNLIDSVRKDYAKTLPKDYIDLTIKHKKNVNYYRVIAKPITNIAGESIGVVTLFQDITKFKEVDDLKSEFVASVSHELRTPIASVLMAAELLHYEIPGKTNEKQKEIISIILEDGNRLKNLINDILDLSKLESGKIQLNFNNYTPQEIIDYVLKILEIRISEENVKIKVEIEKNVLGVKADISKITQVFTNLIENSINYKALNKRIIIELGAKLLNGKVLFYIKDNGRGIPEEDQKKIFDKFIRLEESENIKNKGSGLGLAISKSIIKNHGGDLWVESAIGIGSTFYFTLNLADDKPALI